MNRRAFVRSAFCFAASNYLIACSADTITNVRESSPAPDVPLPVLWGDGEHEDADVLQLVCDRKPVQLCDGTLIPTTGHLYINGFMFRLATSVLNSSTDIHFTNTTWVLKEYGTNTDIVHAETQGLPWQVGKMLASNIALVRPRT